MGITVFSAFLSTAVQQFILLVAAQSAGFQRYPQMMLLVVIKAGITGFVGAPAFMGVLDYVNPWSRWRSQEAAAKAASD